MTVQIDYLSTFQDDGSVNPQLRLRWYKQTFSSFLFSGKPTYLRGAEKKAVQVVADLLGRDVDSVRCETFSEYVRDHQS